MFEIPVTEKIGSPTKGDSGAPREPPKGIKWKFSVSENRCRSTKTDEFFVLNPLKSSLALSYDFQERKQGRKFFF